MKLGLIAMSGVRAHNPELTAMGLTLPGFVERNQVIASLPSLALITLAALTPKRIDVEYIEVPDLNALDHIPGEFDAVAIASFSAQIKDAYTLASRYRALGTIVILGGLHVSAMPEEALHYADSIVIGEAEPIWSHVMDDWLQGRLQPIYDARPTPFDLSQAPMPRFDLLEPNRYNRFTVQTQRGCPLSCEFCASSIRISPRFKVKPVHKVIEEIQAIKHVWGTPFIEFADDNTFVHKRHSKKLLRELQKEQVRWFTETDLSVARDPELLALMRDSGCKQVLIGFESPKRSGLDGLELNTNWKAKQFDFYMQAIETIQSHGITVNGCFILGLDGTDLQSFQDVAHFVQQSGLYDVQVTVQTAFPGTPLYERLRSEKRLLQEDAWELCTLFDVNFTPQYMTVSELEEHFCWLVGEIYSDASTAERRAHFKKMRERGQTPSKM